MRLSAGGPDGHDAAVASTHAAAHDLLERDPGVPACACGSPVDVGSTGASVAAGSDSAVAVGSAAGTSVAVTNGAAAIGSLGACGSCVKPQPANVTEASRSMVIRVRVFCLTVLVSRFRCHDLQPEQNTLLGGP